MVRPLIEVVEEGILEWAPNLVGQVLDKPLPFLLVKNTIENLWRQLGPIQVHSMEKGLFPFKFPDCRIRDAVHEAKTWFVANKPLVLRKWKLGMQMLDLSLSKVLYG